MNCVGIVCYNPDLSRLKLNIDSLSEQADIIYIVDNGSSNIDNIEHLTKQNMKIIIFKNKENQGIAKALNQIIEYFYSIGEDWVLLMDQDSILQKDSIEKYNRYTGMDKVGVICPVIQDDNDISQKPIQYNYDFVKESITSGSFVKIELCVKIGKFDEKMFIDLVDFDFSIRVLEAAMKIIKMNDVVLYHRLGELRVVKFFCKKIYITNHSPIRVYYKTRNYFYLSRKHAKYYTKKFINKKISIMLLKVILFEKFKIKKIHSVIKGYKDSKLM